MFPLNGPRYYGVRWGKQPRVRRHESRPAVPLRWLARKTFFWPIRRRDFKRFWNSFGKSKCPGALPLLLQTFAHENPVVPTSCPWVSEDVVFWDNRWNQCEIWLSKLKSKCPKILIFLLSIGTREMRKGQLKIKIFWKKLTFNITFSVTKRKLKNRKSEKKWMIFIF